MGREEVIIKVKCIYRFTPKFWAFTVGKIYDVINVYNDCYKITDDLDIPRVAHMKFFEVEE